MKFIFIALSCLASLAALGAEQTVPAIAKLRLTHPRLIAEAATWDNLRVQRQTDPQLAALLTAIESNARGILEPPPVAYHKIGRRMVALVFWCCRKLPLPAILGSGARNFSTPNRGAISRCWRRAGTSPM